MDRLIVLIDLWLLLTLLGPRRRYLWQTSHLHHRLILGHGHDCSQSISTE